MNVNMIRRIFMASSIAILMGGCAKTPWYEGYYFDAKINGLKVVEIEDKSSIKNLEDFSRYSSVKWMVKSKAEGDLDVIVNNNSISDEFIGSVGDSEESEVYIYPLDGQDLA